MNTNLISIVRAEIERRIKNNIEQGLSERADSLDSLLSFLSDLEKEENPSNPTIQEQPVKTNIVEDLKHYLATTPKEQIKKDWESLKEWDNVGPSVSEFLGWEHPVCEDVSKEKSLSLQIQAYLNTCSDELYAEGKPLYSEYRQKEIHDCMAMWKKLHDYFFYNKPFQPVSEGLEEEIQSFWNRASGFQPKFATLEVKENGFAVIARHFAKWGAEHAKIESEKPMNLEKMEREEELKKAVHQVSEEIVKEIFPDDLENGDFFTEVDLKNCITRVAYQFADWQKEQMMKEAVEGKVFMSFAPGCNQRVVSTQDVDLPCETKVKLIIIKED